MNSTATHLPVSPPPMRRRTMWLRLSLIALAVIVAMPLGGWLYLHSSHPRHIASQRIGEMIGLPVEVESLSFGSDRTELKITVPNPAVGAAAEPLLRIESVSADVSLRGLVSGQSTPTDIVLRGVEVTVPFDRDGRVRFEMPASVSVQPANGSKPRIRMEEVRVRLKGEGRPEFVFERAHLIAEPDEAGYKLTGAAQDPTWGAWTIAGTIALTTRSGFIEMTTSDGPLDENILRSIPPLPDKTWQHVRTAGRAAATVRLEIDPQQTLRYSVTVMPKGAATVTLPDLDVPLEAVDGTIRVSGQSVTIESCRAKLADGHVDVKGVLDFESVSSKLTFNISAQGLDVTKLPAEWGLPKDISGRLRGKASLELTIGADGRLEPRGGGVATLDDARVVGLPAEVRLRLRGDGRRYRFDSDPAAEPKPKPVPPVPSLLLLLLQPGAAPQETTLDAAITLRDVDVAALLKQLNVDVPYRLVGKITVRITAAVPIGSVTSRQAYRFQGTITSDAFHFEGLKATNVRADLDYREGVLTLRELRVTLPTADGPAGTLTGKAKAEVEPRRALTATLTLTDLPVDQLAKALPGMTIPIRGRVTGEAEFRSGLETLRDPATWTGSARIDVNTLTWGTTETGRLTAKATLAKGVLSLQDTNADLFKGRIEGSANVPLSNASPGKLAVTFRDIDAAEAIRLIPDFPVPLTGRISGGVTASASAVHGNKPRVIDANLDLAAKTMTVQGIPAERLTGKVSVIAGAAEYQLEGHSLGGTFDVKGRYPSKPNEDEPIRVRIQNLDLSRLAASIRSPQLALLRGRINATFDAAPDGSDGTGRVTVDGVSWGAVTIANRITGTISMEDGVLDVRDLTGDVLGGRLRARARYDLRDRRRNFYSLSLDRASGTRLTSVVPLGAVGGAGDVTATARGRFGPGASHSLSLTVANATVAGFPVTDLRMPFEWTGDLARGHVTVRGARASVGNGSVTADLQYTYGPASRVDGLVKFDRVPLRTVIGSAASTFGNGTVRGRFDLKGERIRSLDDLTGTLNASLNHTSVREVPLINVVSPFLSPFGFLQPFEAGEVRGRLAKGVFRLERFVLSNPAAHVFADGSITRQGRLDLDVVAATGQIGPNGGALKLIGLSVPKFGALPLTVVTQVTNLLSNRMVRLSVTGTIENPNVRVNTAALLSDTVVRFFIGQYVLPEGLSGVGP